MKPRGLLIAAVVLLALCGVLYWSNHHPPAAGTPAGATPDAAATPAILTLNQSDVAQLTIQDKGQPALELSRTGSGGNWQITAPKQLDADQDAVSGVLSVLSSLAATRVVETTAANLAPYGLSDPSATLDVTLNNKKTQKLLIGDETPAGSGYYAMLAGDPRVFIIASYSKTGLDKSLGDLRDKRLVTTDFDKVSQIELTSNKAGKKSDITFGRNKDAWQILKPQPLRADGSQVESLIQSLKDGKMDTSADTDEAKIAAAFKSATPLATVKLTGAGGTQELEVRDSKGDEYVKSSAPAGIFKAQSGFGAGLDKTLDDFRNKKLFDFGYDEPNKIELTDGPKSYALSLTNNSWWDAAGKKLDDATVDALVENLRELSAVSFPETGFTAPAVTITVTSNDGKRVEKVLASKSGDNYIAKRDGEPELYEIPGSAISDLEKSADGLKPVAPPPAPKK